MNPSPFYSRVPKDPKENVAYRRMIRTRAADDKGLQRALLAACRADLLYWVNVFGTIVEPRSGLVLPFVTWDFQDPFLLKVNECIGVQDMGAEKSRDMAASWGILTVFLWRFLFFDWQSFLLVSRVEDLVDSPGNPDCLMWKLDFAIARLPPWMRPEVERSSLHLANPTNNSVIDGMSTTGNVGRSGRRLAVMMDEFAFFEVSDGYKALASTQSVTNSRFMPSTPNGAVGAFYDVMKSPRMKRIVRYRLHWSEHPYKKPGLYTSEGGRLRVIDTAYGFPPDYAFVMDGKLRSPWYDAECERAPIPALIPQELDIDYLGSNHPFYPPAVIDRCMAEDCTDPMLVGELLCDEDVNKPIEFIEQRGGRLKLWFQPDATTLRPPASWRCVAGADICMGNAGVMSSNSVIAIARSDTGEKVAELTTACTEPADLGRHAVALMRWFNNAKLCWEANGPGKIFGPAVIGAGYREVHYRQRDESLNPNKREMTYGWPATGPGKLLLHGAYSNALRHRQFINRSAAALEECRHYVYAGNTVQHDRAAAETDPSGAGENHGDHVVADALCWKMMADVPRNEVQEEVEREAPPGSLKWRQQMAEREREEEMELA